MVVGPSEEALVTPPAVPAPVLPDVPSALFEEEEPVGSIPELGCADVHCLGGILGVVSQPREQSVADGG